MIRFGKDGITTDEATIAAMFLDERIEMYWHGAWCLISLYDDWDISVNGFAWSTGEEGYEKLSDMIRIPYALVWQAIQPVEGEACFAWPVHRKEAQQPTYRWDGDMRSLENGSVDSVLEAVVAANALTIGKTVGELRELIERARPKE